MRVPPGALACAARDTAKTRAIAETASGTTRRCILENQSKTLATSSVGNTWSYGAATKVAIHAPRAVVALPLRGVRADSLARFGRSRAADALARVVQCPRVRKGRRQNEGPEGHGPGIGYDLQNRAVDARAV